MTAFDRQQVIEDAARALWEPGVIYGGKRFGWDDLKEDSRRRLREVAAAALPVTVAAVLKPIRELHAADEPVCVETGHTPSRCPCSEVFCESCDDPMPCPTVQLLDEIEADCKGGE